MRRGFWVGLVILLLVSLAIGVFWTMRLNVPTNPRPWWFGTETVVRAEVWEPGKDMPTFAMTLPKKTLDAMYALGMKSVINVGDHKVRLSQIWGDLQRLPKGQKLTMHENGSTLTIWIEEKGARTVTHPDSAAAS